MEYGCQRFSLAHLCFGRPATRATDVISCFLIVNMSTNFVRPGKRQNGEYISVVVC